MTDRPASWRTPSRKEMEKMASALGRKAPPAPALAPSDDLPSEYWQALLDDARADARSPTPSSAALRLTEMSQHVLRVNCRRCGRTIEIQKVDAVQLYGERAVWKEVGHRLLDDTCTQRTGRHDEDGRWPSYSK
jgi:hypothetical protein